MAVRDTSKKPYLQDEDEKIKIGIDLPIRRDSELDGFFATTSTTIEAVKNNIRNLLQTNEGERFFQPNLGTEIRDTLFENFSRQTVNIIEDQVRDTVRAFEPRVGDVGVEVVAIPDNNNFEVKVLFEIRGLEVAPQSFTFILEPSR